MDTVDQLVAILDKVIEPYRDKLSEEDFIDLRISLLQYARRVHLGALMETIDFEENNGGEK